MKKAHWKKEAVGIVVAVAFNFSTLAGEAAEVVSSMAGKEPAAYRLVVLFQESGAVTRSARLLSREPLKQRTARERWPFAEVAEGLVWLPASDQGETCSARSRELVIAAEPTVPEIQLIVRAECQGAMLALGPGCHRYRIDISGIPAPRETTAGEKDPFQNDGKEVVLHGQGDAIFCEGEALARAAAMAFERETVLPLWERRGQERTERGSAALSWVALP